eukprot:gnl/TRDRNA2_/TRDRNA2_29056_c0_seq1.p1 gnl/TRDRNA2_/TRDRNA2_29056_c0~~gnl/TRDRNA2_/TRDRNA2_29056_c0_seq1.p1  ORF type:complete len:198 (+),score=29.03 gnl/TRDRNA2_/TRDRNA2_29056_c0_seq1:215-808(+)
MQKNQCRQLLFGVSMLLFVAGWIVLGVGLEKKVTAGNRDPATDFEAVSGNCSVVAVSHVGEYVEGKQNYCYDKFRYRFARMSDPSIVVNSGIEVCVRNVGQCNGEPGKPTHSVGSVVPCWQPAGGVQTAHLEAFYDCGNGECLKMINPVTVYDANVKHKVVLLGIGGALAFVGTTGCLFSGCCLLKTCRQKEESLYT